jgi:hypothetical protein
MLSRQYRVGQHGVQEDARRACISGSSAASQQTLSAKDVDHASGR